MRSNRLTSECHLVDTHAGMVAYWPLKSVALQVNAAGAALLARLRAGPVSRADDDELRFLEQLEAIGLVNGSPDATPDRAPPDEPCPTRTMLLISERCSLRCVYCYGEAVGRGRLMEWPIARAAVDLLVASALRRNSGSIELGFHGGGEPCINWPVLTRSIEYGARLCQEKGLGFRSTICTNGILSRQKSEWLARHLDSLTVSIDGPAPLHDRQRPFAGGAGSFDILARTIDILQAHGRRPAFRITATGLGEGALEGAYRYLTERFSPAVFCVEPLFLCGRCTTSQATPPAAEAFIQDFARLLEASTERGVPVQYSGGRFELLTSRFCGAAGQNFFVTPAGDVTSCVEVSSRADPRSAVFFYGRYDTSTGAFTFSREKHQRLLALSLQSLESCRDCFARWHCAGDCLAKAPDMGALERTRNAYRCRINQAVTKLLLLRSMRSREGQPHVRRAAKQEQVGGTPDPGCA